MIIKQTWDVALQKKMWVVPTLLIFYPSTYTSKKVYHKKGGYPLHFFTYSAALKFIADTYKDGMKYYKEY
jgi:hypothetical protein